MYGNYLHKLIMLTTPLVVVLWGAVSSGAQVVKTDLATLADRCEHAGAGRRFGGPASLR
jgi:hypothetical protein